MTCPRCGREMKSIDGEIICPKCGFSIKEDRKTVKIQPINDGISSKSKQNQNQINE